MDRRQTLVVVGLMVAVFIGIVAATYFVKNSGGARAALDSTKRFTAKSGTSRDNAVALTSSKRESEPGTSSPASAGGGGAAGDAGGNSIEALRPIELGEREEPLTVKSLSRPEKEEELSSTERAIYSARNSLNTVKAIQQLEALADEGMDGESASALHLALGELYGQKNPPDEARAQAAFERARALARGRADRQEAQLAEARMLVANEKYELAGVKLQTALAGDDLDTPAGLKLGVLYGQLHEREEDLAAAETVYRATFNRGLQMAPRDAEESLRIAGMRLARIYQLQERDEEADAVAVQLQRWLKAPPDQGDPTSPRK